MLDDYHAHEAERAAMGIPPLPLNAEQVREVITALGNGGPGDADRFVRLLSDRVPPGVTDAARVKAAYLADLARGGAVCASISPAQAVALLGTMVGGHNVAPLVELLDHDELGAAAGEQLSRLLLVFDAFDDVVGRAKRGNPYAAGALRSWAETGWLTQRPPVPDAIHLTVFKVDGETNTDDLSPATEAWSRADIPLHARSFLQHRLGDGVAPGEISELAAAGRPIAFVGDVVGTGSSRKSAVNSLQWHIGHDVPNIPNKRSGGVVIAGRIAPIFYDTLRDSGALPIACDADAGGIGRMATGDHIVVRPADGRIESPAGDLLASFPPSGHLLDGVRAGGRIPLIIGRRLARRASEALGLDPARATQAAPAKSAGYTLAQKMVGRACGVAGVSPGSYCEPVVATVGSQDTTGPMNRTELEDLACLQFGADLVVQTFCHTAAYPKPADVETQRTLPDFMGRRGAVVLRPGDGIIHSWINRMLLPDQVGTGSDSHTRFPLGISFPAGSALVAFAAAFGVMPLTMPESVLVRFRGEQQPGVTLRDLVNAIPYVAADRSVFNGRIIEIEGLEDLTVEQAFELTDATAERSAAACTITLTEATVAAHLRSSIELLHALVDAGYEGAAALERRIEAMERWLAEPALLRPDPDATYAAVVEVDLDTVTEPLLACPNDPDDVRPLSEVAGQPIDEVFLGSCMTNLDHFRAAGRLLAEAEGAVPTRLWIAPPTRLVERQLRADGHYATFGAAGARTEIPGCSLCMGNQARVAQGATVVSTSTRNFPNRMGRDARVFLGSAEVATIAATLGRLPTLEEYRDHVRVALPGARS